jgi:hypothetical protein
MGGDWAASGGGRSGPKTPENVLENTKKREFLPDGRHRATEGRHA